MTDFVGNLKKGQSLTFEESKSLFTSLMDGKFEETEIIEILEALIKKGETKTVSFEITKDQLEFYTVDKIWDVEPGNFRLGIGGDSQIKLGAIFKVQ